MNHYHEWAANYGQFMIICKGFAQVSDSVPDVNHEGDYSLFGGVVTWIICGCQYLKACAVWQMSLQLIPILKWTFTMLARF